MYDLSTTAGMLRFCESKRAEMARCFERVGRFEENGQSFCAYLIATHEMVKPKNPRNVNDWATGARLSAPKAVLCSMPKGPLVDLLSEVDPNGLKDAYAEALRIQGKLQRAIGYVFMTEMWMVQTSAPKDHPDPRAAAYEERKKLPESLEFAPGRGEALMLTLEHQAAGQAMWTAEITRNPTRLHEWEKKDYQASEGRFVDITQWRQ